MEGNRDELGDGYFEGFVIETLPSFKSSAVLSAFVGHRQVGTNKNREFDLLFCNGYEVRWDNRNGVRCTDHMGWLQLAVMDG